jgi:membrane protein
MSDTQAMERLKHQSFFKQTWTLLRTTMKEWGEDGGAALAASLSYYAVFSLAPVLVIAVAIAGFFFGREAARGEVVGEIDQFVGAQGAELVEGMLANASEPSASGLAALLGVATLLFGATGVFSSLQSSINHIWDLPTTQGGGIMGFLRTRLISFLLVMGTGAILLASLLVGAAISAASRFAGQLGLELTPIWQWVNYGATFVLLALAFAVIYRALPDTEVAWRDVWPAAIIVSLLFAVLRWGLGIYLANNGTVSTYGAAGSLVILLIWVYLSAQILFLGAEFSQVYSRTLGSRSSERALVQPQITLPAEVRRGSPGLSKALALQAVAASQARRLRSSSTQNR